MIHIPGIMRIVSKLKEVNAWVIPSVLPDIFATIA